jgi:sec-independent protein translocase protein TatA
MTLTDMMMQFYGLGGLEWVIIIIIVILLIFGVKKIPELARNFGKVSAEFQKARIEAKREIESIRSQSIDPDREKLEEIADKLGIEYLGKTDDELRLAIDTELKKIKK